jgi:hypothetical protein
MKSDQLTRSTTRTSSSTDLYPEGSASTGGSRPAQSSDALSRTPARAPPPRPNRPRTRVSHVDGEPVEVGDGH